MELVKVEMSVGKNVKEVCDCVKVLITEMKKIKGAAEIPAALMKHVQELYVAVDGATEIPAEAEAELAGTVGYAGYSIVGALKAS